MIAQHVLSSLGDVIGRDWACVTGLVAAGVCLVAMFTLRCPECDERVQMSLALRSINKETHCINCGSLLEPSKWGENRDKNS
ncbi:MAG: hypothetical protein LBU61_06875 [Coriobacteriales bacterium]|nr:hypothetical protein [Coriobacteriales bacterium]